MRRKKPTQAQNSIITLITGAKKITNIPQKKKKNRIKSELDNYLKSEFIFLFIRERESLTHHIS